MHDVPLAISASAAPVAPVAITDTDKQLAGQFLEELQSSLLILPLHHRSGHEEAVVANIQEVYATGRRLLDAASGAKTFGNVTRRFLNEVLQPRLIRWQGWMSRKRFPSEYLRRKFREELKELSRLSKDVEAYFELIKTSSADEVKA